MIARHQALRARVAEQLTRLPIRPTHAPAASAAEAVDNQIDAASGKGFFRILLVAYAPAKQGNDRQGRSRTPRALPAASEVACRFAARLLRSLREKEAAI